jgi:hypothetical protein
MTIMLSTQNAWRITNAVAAAALSLGITAMVEVRLRLHLLALPIVFVVAWSLFFLFLDSLFVRRAERVKKNVPITSKERGRRQKRFYDSLPR